MFNRFADVSTEDHKLIGKIAERYQKEFSIPADHDRLDMIMDIGACHVISPLNLQTLLDFPLPDFSHDISGISRHLDRETGKLLNCFLPRSAKKRVYTPEEKEKTWGKIDPDSWRLSKE